MIKFVQLDSHYPENSTSKELLNGLHASRFHADIF